MIIQRPILPQAKARMPRQRNLLCSPHVFWQKTILLLQLPSRLLAIHILRPLSIPVSWDSQFQVPDPAILQLGRCRRGHFSGVADPELGEERGRSELDFRGCFGVGEGVRAAVFEVVGCGQGREVDAWWAAGTGHWDGRYCA